MKLGALLILDRYTFAASGRPIHRFADASADASADGHRPMVPSVFSKPSADGFYFKNHRFSEKMAEKDHLGNILRK